MHVTKPDWFRRAAAVVLGVLLAIAAGSPNAFARQTIALTIPGFNTIDLISFSTTTSATPPAAKCGQVVVLKHIDQASSFLLTQVFLGQHTQRMTITFKNDTTGVVFYTLDLEDVLVKEVTQSDSASASQLTETVTLIAVRYKYTFSAPTALTAGYDCAAQKTI